MYGNSSVLIMGEAKRRKNLGIPPREKTEDIKLPQLNKKAIQQKVRTTLYKYPGAGVLMGRGRPRRSRRMCATSSRRLSRQSRKQFLFHPFVSTFVAELITAPMKKGYARAYGTRPRFWWPYLG